MQFSVLPSGRSVCAMGSTCDDGVKRASALASRQAVVARAEAYVQAHLATPLPVSHLCHVLGVSERGLRNAFYGVRGMGPKRRMLALRLQGVHHALAKEWAEPTTVTHVATRYGFYELGRFAATYKLAFGEVPSATLYGTARRSGRATGKDKEGHSDVCSILQGRRER
jgi:transcriptional regulator GlxA family with amidase domain